jgi:hypothetical protein
VDELLLLLLLTKQIASLVALQKVNQIKLFLLTMNRSLIIFHFGITGQLCSFTINLIKLLLGDGGGGGGEKVNQIILKVFVSSRFFLILLVHNKYKN